MADLLVELRATNPVRTAPPVTRGALDHIENGVGSSRRRPGHPYAWAGGLAAAAAVAVAVVLTWQAAMATGRVPASPFATPGTSSAVPATGWMRTSAVPLSPRSDSVTAWIGGRFYLIGGDTARPCEPPADCKSGVRRDGATYDPATDIWTRIADAPEPVLGYVSPSSGNTRTAVVGGVLYLWGTKHVLAYDVAANTWRQFPFPLLRATPVLVNVRGTLIAVVEGADTATYAMLDLTKQDWDNHRSRTALPGTLNAAVVVADRLIISGAESSQQGRPWAGELNTDGRITFIDTSTVGPQDRTPYGPTPAVAGRAAFLRGERGWFYEPTTRSWSSVAWPTMPGAFDDGGRPGDGLTLVTTSMVALNGHLYEPASGLWSQTPALPVTGTNPVLVGAEQVLACFGYQASAAAWGTGCYLLRPEPASQRTP